MCDVLPLYDIICMYALMFHKKCLGNSSDVVSYVTTCGVFTAEWLQCLVVVNVSRLECEVLQKARYKYTYLYLYL